MLLFAILLLAASALILPSRVELASEKGMAAQSDSAPQSPTPEFHQAVDFVAAEIGPGWQRFIMLVRS